MDEITNTKQINSVKKDDKVVEQPDLKKRKPFLLIGAVMLLFVITVIVITVCVKSSGNKKSEYDKKIDLGKRYLSELDYEQAILAFEEAIKIDPKRDDAYILLAETYVTKGDIDTAKTILDDAVEETKSDRTRTVKRKIRKIKKIDDNNINQVIQIFEEVITDNDNEMQELIEDEEISDYEKYTDNEDNNTNIVYYI